jgi:PKD repeat protein
MNKRGVLVLILLVIFSSFVSSSIEIGNLSHQIDKTYAPNSRVRGWINISFSDKLSNSLFEDSFDNSISLKDFLNFSGMIKDRDYSCFPSDCLSDYSATNAQETKSFSLGSSEQKVGGFKISGRGVVLNSVNFSVNSNAQESTSNQLKFDFLNNGVFETGNYKKSSNNGLKLNGCFNSSQSSEETTLGEAPPLNKHCQKIKLLEAPGYKLGAWVKREANPKNITFALYSENFVPIEDVICTVSPSPSTSGEVSCEVNYLVKEEKDYYVCVYSEGIGTTPKIRGYYSENGCGFYSAGKGMENYAYQIFAQAKKFGPIGDIRLNNPDVEGISLAGYLQDYLLGKYGSFGGGADCSSGCVIPFKIFSFVNQNIQLKDLLITYQDEMGGGKEMKTFQDISEIPSKISSKDFLIMNFNKTQFSVPGSFGNKTFRMFFDGETIFSEKIVIEKIPAIYGVYPLKTFSAFPTKFYVTANASEPNTTITEYFWDFGDNITKITTVNEVEHIYNSSGSYSFKISVKDSRGKISDKTFGLVVISPEEAINTTLIKKLSDLEKVKNKTNSFSEFEKNTLSSVLDLEEKNRKLKNIQSSFLQGGQTEIEKNNLLKELLAIYVPEEIEIIGTASDLAFYPDREKISLNALKSFGGGDYKDEETETFLDSIMKWNLDKLNFKISYNEFVTIYGEEQTPLLKIFDINLEAKESISYNPYFIMENLENLTFKENYLEEKKENFVGIKLSTFPRKISFATTEEIDPLNPPIFVSPVLNRLDIVVVNITPEKPRNWWLLILIWTLLILIFLIIYILLQEWYARRYETHLFKDRNNLLNLVTYIEISKNKGLSENEIQKSLKKAGWNSEQIIYSIKKHAGKRTGMFEIPFTRKLVEKIENLFKKKEIKSEKQRPLIPGVRYNPGSRFLK